MLDASGDGSVALGSGPLGVSASSVAFGAGLCGGTAVSKTLTVSNSGTTDLTVAVAITGAVFTADTTNLAVPAGSSATLTLKATIPGSATAGTALAGSLKLTANDAAHDAVTLDLGVTPTGATLAFAADLAHRGRLPDDAPERRGDAHRDGPQEHGQRLGPVHVRRPGCRSVHADRGAGVPRDARRRSFGDGDGRLHADGLDEPVRRPRTSPPPAPSAARA